MPSQQTPPQALSTSFFTTHTEETQHEDLDVSELVDELIKDVNTNNTELNHQPFAASTDQLSHDRYGEAEYWATSMPLDTSTHSMFKYQDLSPVNEANYETGDRHNVEQVSRYDMKLDKCSQDCWNRQTEVQTRFEDMQHPVEMEVFDRTPYSYNNREEESLGDEHEVANGEDDCGQYAKNITKGEKLFDNCDWNVGVATNEDKITDDDEELDKDEEKDKTEEIDGNKSTNDDYGRTDEDYNVVGEDIGHEDTDEEIDEEVNEDEEFDDDDVDDDDDDDDVDEDFDTEFEGDEEFDIDTSSEFTVGEVDVDTDTSSSHSGYCFSDQDITHSHGCKDIRVLAYLTSSGSSQAAREEMKLNSVEQFPNTIATDADEALCTILEEDECSARIMRSKGSITSSTIYFDNQTRQDLSRTSLDAPEGDLECTAMYSEDITNAGFDETNSGVTRTQEFPKVG